MPQAERKQRETAFGAYLEFANGHDVLWTGDMPTTGRSWAMQPSPVRVHSFVRELSVMLREILERTATVRLVTAKDAVAAQRWRTFSFAQLSRVDGGRRRSRAGRRAISS